MELKRYFALVLHWLWLIILSALICGVAAYLFSKSQTPLYRAQAKYQVYVASGGGSNNQLANTYIADNLVKTYEEIIPTMRVAQTALDRLREIEETFALYEADDVLNAVSVNSPLETQVIDISAIDSDPERAAAIANMMGDVFAEQQELDQSRGYTNIIRDLDGQLADIDVDLDNVKQEISTFGEPNTTAEQIELDRLTRQQNELQQTFNNLFSRRLDLEIEQTTSTNTIISAEKALANYNAISPRTNINTILAVFLGGLLALGGVVLLDSLDDSVKSPDEIRNELGISTLASIAFIKGDKPSDRLVTFSTPRAPVSEAFRVLRTNLGFAAIDTGLKSALVTSSSPSEGKSTTSANIAVVMAQAGKRVILIDADLRRPSQHKIFALSNNHGLTTALLDNNTRVQKHLQSTQVPGLRLMASGPLPPNPAELLNSQRMREVIDELLHDADFVLVDTPPVLTVADAAILAPNVDGCVLVAELGKTRRDMLASSSSRLQTTGATLYGLVLNRSKPGRTGYYQYYQNEGYYNYEYTAAQPTNQQGRLRGWISGLTGSGD